MRIRIGDVFLRDGKKIKIVDIRYSQYYRKKCLICDVNVGNNPEIPIDCLIYDELLEIKQKRYINQYNRYVSNIDEKINKLLKIK